MFVNMKRCIRLMKSTGRVPVLFVTRQAEVGRHRISRSREVLGLYRKRANTPCSCRRLARSRFRYNPKTQYKGRPSGGGFGCGSLRSDCRQGSEPAPRRCARTSLRVLDRALAPAPILLWWSRRSPFLACARSRFHGFSLVLEVMPLQENRSARPVSRNFLARIKERSLGVSWECCLKPLQNRKERSP